MTNPLQPQFTEVLVLIQSAQQKVLATTNQELIKLYWSIGKYISDCITAPNRKLWLSVDRYGEILFIIWAIA